MAILSGSSMPGPSAEEPGPNADMTLDEMAAITRYVIRNDGLADYLPTAYFPNRGEFCVLDDVPDGVDVEIATRDWAQQMASAGEVHLLAFKVDASHFKVIRLEGGGSEEAVFQA